MWKLLEKLRQKSDSQKILISFLGALVITIIIVLLWLPTVIKKDDEKLIQIENTQEKRDPVSDVTPISNLGSQISEIKQIWNEAFNQLKKEETPTLNATTTIDLNQATTSQIESSQQ